jgi:hypothetical protein
LTIVSYLPLDEALAVVGGDSAISSLTAPPLAAAATATLPAAGATATLPAAGAPPQHPCALSVAAAMGEGLLPHRASGGDDRIRSAGPSAFLAWAVGIWGLGFRRRGMGLASRPRDDKRRRRRRGLGFLGWVFFTDALRFLGSAVMTVSAEVGTPTRVVVLYKGGCASCAYSWLGWQMISAARSRRCVLVIHGYSYSYQQNDVFLYGVNTIGNTQTRTNCQKLSKQQV